MSDISLNGYVLRHIAGEYNIVNCSSNTTKNSIVLNETGAFVFSLLAKGMELNTISKEVSKFFGIPLDNAVIDVTCYINELKKIGVVI